jgi:hypothetical protein
VAGEDVGAAIAVVTTDKQGGGAAGATRTRASRYVKGRWLRCGVGGSLCGGATRSLARCGSHAPHPRPNHRAPSNIMENAVFSSVSYKQLRLCVEPEAHYILLL